MLWSPPNYANHTHAPSDPKSLFSLARGLVTKNRNVLKLPSRDLISGLMLVLAMIELDPAHPICRSVTVAYWPHDDPVGDLVCNRSDAAMLWGGAESISAMSAKVAAGAPVVAYGPRWSLSVLDLDDCDMAEAAMRVVADVVIYDQEACLSTQRLFVRGNVDEFVLHLMREFARASETRRMNSPNRDLWARRAIALLDARYRGMSVVSGGDYAVIVDNGDWSPETHPLTRTLVIHPTRELGRVAGQLDRNVQAVGVNPYALAERYRDEWATAGVRRVYESGFARSPREGFTHDGILALRT